MSKALTEDQKKFVACMRSKTPAHDHAHAESDSAWLAEFAVEYRGWKLCMEYINVQETKSK